MGAGSGGCIGKGAKPAVAAATAAATSATVSKGDSSMVKVYVVFYSMYGHVYKMAEAFKEGVDSVEGCEAMLYQVEETLSDEILGKMGAPPKPDVPVLNPKDLENADGIAFGMPTRFGMMCSQMKAMFDATGGLWQAGKLVGKPAACFVSTGTQGGGQETTALTTVTQLVHHGMIFVPPGYTAPEEQFQMTEIIGGSPYGAGTYAGPDGSRQPSKMELSRSTKQGAYFAEKVKKLAA